MNGRGRFITFEGGEGAGKSTQLRLLAQDLAQTGREVITTREPGGSDGAEAIRSLLVTGDVDRWDGYSEALLHSAARRDHLRRTIWPALDRGAWVLCDRFADSTLAYQGYGHGLPMDWITDLTRLTLGEFAPDLTLILDMPAAEGLARAVKRGGGEDRYERMGGAFHQRLRDGFLEIAATDPARCAVIDAVQSVDAVRADIAAEIRARLGYDGS